GSGGTEFGASINPGGGTLTVFSFTGTPLNNPDYSTHDFSVATVNDPPGAQQPNDSRTLDTGTAGEQTAVWQNGILWSAGNTACVPGHDDSTTRSCLAFHEVNTGNMSLLTDTWLAQPNAYLFYPAVMPDPSGNLFVGHSISSSTQYGTAGDTYFAGGL